ncbi:MAG TPA: hypothetical protein VF508_11190 [Pyrinomonadaceae bacterium]
MTPKFYAPGAGKVSGAGSARRTPGPGVGLSAGSSADPMARRSIGG